MDSTNMKPRAVLGCPCTVHPPHTIGKLIQKACTCALPARARLGQHNTHRGRAEAGSGGARGRERTLRVWRQGNVL